VSQLKRRAAVLGHPIEHSLSPVLHSAAYAELGLDWIYDRHDVTTDQLAGFLDSCGPEWAGLSLTMPLKTDVIELLDDISALARTVSAVNTVLFRDGRRIGDNTDVPGMVAALRRVDSAAQYDGAVILGGGATARSALMAVSQLGVNQVAVYVRRPEIGDELAPLAAAANVDLVVEPWQRAAEGLLADLVISTAPAGATDTLANDVPHRPGTLLDVVYAPWPTSLAQRWSDEGGVVASGLDLLVEQAALQVELMTGMPAPIDAMRHAGQLALDQ
jgi:shikimate dehydrogenase